MKADRIPENIFTVAVILGGLLLAIYLGSSIGSGQTMQPLMLVGVMTIFAVLLTLKEKSWIFIFLLGGIPGKIMFLPLSLTVREVGVLLAFGGIFLMFIFRRIKVKPDYRFLDVLAMVNVLYIALLFVRNPVGTLVLDTDRIGGRPYFTLLIAVCAYFALTRSTASLKVGRLLPLVSIASVGVQAMIGAVNFFFPSTVPMMAHIYGGLTLATYNAAQAGTGGDSEGRYGFGKGLSERGMHLLCAFYRPLSLMNPLHLWRFLAALALFGLMLSSGFRSALLDLFLAFCIASWFHRKAGDIFVAFIIGICGIVLLASMQGTVVTLPQSVQRTLSFLPGNWDAAVAGDAEGSKNWRVEMWKTMLTDDRYIKNKMWGDGFGYSLADFLGVVVPASSDPSLNQEAFMILGEVHSGPVSSIRCGGYVGLGLYLWLGFLAAMHWGRLIRRAYGTPMFIAILFFGIPGITAPLKFVFIFGGYETAVAGCLTSIAYMHFLRRILNQYFIDEAAKEAEENRLPEKMRASELPGRLEPAAV